MAKLKELIAECCSGEVGLVELGDLLNYEQPGKYMVSDTHYSDKYRVPVLTAGQTFILGYTSEQSGLFHASKNTPVIIFDDFTTSFHWVDFDFKVKSSALKILMPKDDTVNLRYIYYAMKGIHVNVVEHSRQWISKFSKKKIPFPHEKVQAEIVCLLDSFHFLLTGLALEIKKREQQFCFYRDYLIVNRCLEEKTGTIHDIIQEKGYIRGPFGSALKKDDMVPMGVPVYEQQHAIEGHRIFRYFVSPEKAAKLKRFEVKKDDIIISCSGTVGRVSIIQYDDPAGIINQALLILRVDSQKIDVRYLKYFFETKRGHDAILAKTNKGAQINVCARELFEQILLPIPDIEIQKTIVEQLDLFSEGIVSLKREYELRSRQFDYYRERIFSFS